jgi:hypothetical protein
MVREGPPEPPPAPKESPVKTYPADKARGGEIILRTTSRKAIFIAGLVGGLVLAFLISLFVR